MSMTNETIEEKSEILFVYDSIYSIPNGDPFTGEQRYDEETKHILVSDVRIKRFIRDYLLAEIERGSEDEYEIYIQNVESESGKGSGSAARVELLAKDYKDDTDVQTDGDIDPEELLKKCVDVRLFGGVSTKEGMAVNLTGPVQFALLNPSLNRTDLRMHQNTSVFKSDVSKSRGTIGTTTVVPYSLLKIHGWINPFAAKNTGLSEDDVQLMFETMWDSINNANTRSKSNQSSLLLLQIVYADPRDKLYRVGDLIDIEATDGKQEEQMRGPSDYEFDFTALHEAVTDDMVKEVRYHAALNDVEEALLDGAASDKFTEMPWR